MGVELLSTGGTFRALDSAGIPVKEVSDFTDFPEMMDGRVKTLHPKIHGGILNLREEASHQEAMAANGIEHIDLVVVNLYPFEETVAKPGVARADAIEQIDIGGPSMVRSAAKNHRYVGIVTDSADYGRVLDEMQRLEGSLSTELRRDLASRAFALTARYDAAISQWMHAQELADGMTDSVFPDSFAFAGTKSLDLRYGNSGEPSVASAEVLNGKALSYNNLVDLDAAHALAKEFDGPFVAVTKHNNPCGAAAAESIEDALEAAWAGDPLSAFGSVLAFTRPVNLACADFLVSGNRFVEAIVAPSFDDDAFDLLTGKPNGEYHPNGRQSSELELKKLTGGFLLQGRDLNASTGSDLECGTQTKATDEQVEGLLFAEKIAKHVKSNAIVLAKGNRVLGVGAGQMSRVDAVRMAIHKAGDDIAGSVLASDAFFPFPDGVEVAIEAGVKAILQPGGSVRDGEVIAACDAGGAAMVFTGERHFRH
ncbi:UNVERIFIED_CONTAM: hypothetical protein GTU68_025838 [Idotea baltica]|nr:hypothetical protein [Idotea baltica]